MAEDIKNFDNPEDLIEHLNELLDLMPNVPKRLPMGLPASPEETVDMLLKVHREELAKLEKDIAGLRRAASINEMRHATELAQAECPHRKPNQVTAFAGQFDHQDTLHLVCAYCTKNVHLSPQMVRTFRERTLIGRGPLEEVVRDRWETIGGPSGAPVSPVMMGSNYTYKELRERDIAARGEAIDLYGLDPEDLPLAAIEAIFDAIAIGQKFMEKKEK